MTHGLHISAAELAAPAGALRELERFYVDTLGLASRSSGEDRLELAVGPASLGFAADPGGARPFYHFALLLPGNRFGAAREWLAAATPLLARPGSDETTFEFSFWDAQACYAHDPAANILELIAHRGLEESDRTGPFEARELRGLSEVGLVAGGLTGAVHVLGDAGLELWSGNVAGEVTDLGFVGRKAHTLILAPPGRPWLPTGRPAEVHPVTVTVATADGSTVQARVGDRPEVLVG